ncbi:putative 4-hydroxy-4-methyl-2-oxoglutarate aldolase [Paraburkholderia sp. PGU19]|uniref:ribonuclease E activity regulator RraA n=1 Tax=Paraburkholderia sp. PGU19 TaxID=2735434 RepID=UPI0015D9C52C|nr:ribonuclease E activity regulator RraA [Paraburkholderia sp. PGU19]BCF96849.1 putative 4-hydroxy-4-methyl-2-oxoglutarate aldolase [Paraburkholderia sp. PGU19]
MNFATADLCDSHEDQLAAGTLRVLDPVFSRFGRASCFGGEAVTLKVFEDNTLVRATLEEKGAGRVLVIDGGGSLRCALVGGNLGKLSEKNGWAGIVVYGCVRDVLELNECNIGIVALATHPQRSEKRGGGERDVPVRLPGSAVRPGEWVYADSDGVLVASAPLM